VRVDGSFDSNSALPLRKAALAGLGIALLPEEYIAGRHADQDSSPMRGQTPGNRAICAIAAYPTEGSPPGVVPDPMVQARASRHVQPRRAKLRSKVASAAGLIRFATLFAAANTR